MTLDLRDRISFDPDNMIMEADFSNLTFETDAEANAFYDQIEDLIHATGTDKWFFLVNYRNCRFMPEAWLAHSLRGKRLNLTHSLGSVRYDASEETKAEIKRRANTENFDPNLFDNREAAVERIDELRKKLPPRPQPVAPSKYNEAFFDERLRFLEDIEVMDVDFSDVKFESNGDVNLFYDFAEKRLAATGRRWYFLVNYYNCDIDLRAWISFSQRGKKLNEVFSLGSVRYGTDQDTETEIRTQATTRDFRPNIRESRLAALARIAELRAAAHS